MLCVCASLLSLGPWQAKVEALELEKASLEEATHKARHTMAAMQAELSTIHTEYASTSAALQQVTGR